jgi:hypothetical protein
MDRGVDIQPIERRRASVSAGPSTPVCRKNEIGQSESDQANLKIRTPSMPNTGSTGGIAGRLDARMWLAGV